VYQKKGKGSGASGAHKTVGDVDFSGIGGNTFDFGISMMTGSNGSKKKKGKKATPPTYKDALKRQRRREPHGGTKNPHTR
tara:strand:+ start:1279 stop:1518 length:240 start_codon:yes stop_codon:yes gene_type:complete